MTENFTVIDEEDFARFKKMKIKKAESPSRKTDSFIDLNDDDIETADDFLTEKQFDDIFSKKLWKVLICQNAYLIKSTLIKQRLPNPLFFNKKTQNLEKDFYSW